MTPRLLFPAALLALAACTSTSNDYLRLQASAYENTISVGDELNITDGLTGQPVLASARVSPDGTIELPRLGEVVVTGWSADRLRRELDRRYRAEALPTRLSVEITPPAASITVLGEVRREGRLALTPGMTVSQAVAAAGPDPDYADLFRVRIVRTSQGKELVQKIDLRRIEAGDRSFDVVLRDGDIVHVPLTAFGRAVTPVRSDREGLRSDNRNELEPVPPRD